jgi:hypothetical protein
MVFCSDAVPFVVCVGGGNCSTEKSGVKYFINKRTAQIKRCLKDRQKQIGTREGFS